MLQSVQGHTGLAHHFYLLDIPALWCSGLSDRVPECQKIEKGGLDQYGPECSGRLIFATVKKCGNDEGLTFFLPPQIPY